MQTYNVGTTTLTIGNKVITNFAIDDIIEVAFPNPKTSRTNGSGSVTVTHREDGDVADVTLRVAKFSEDDIYLARLMQSKEIFNGKLKSNISINGQFVISGYTFLGGSFTTQPTDRTNNNEAQNMMEYVIQFRQGLRDFK